MPRIPAVIEYPKHRGLVIAEVDGRPVRLGDLAAHLKAHYDPHIEERWQDPVFRRELNVRNLPLLLYQYVDLLCLRAEVEQRKDIKLANFEKLVDRLLREDFDRYKKQYQKRMNRPVAKSSEPALRNRHRRERGLGMEVQAYLELLQPGYYKTSELRRWFERHGNYFGGEVKFAHIRFATRDPVTGRLLPEREQRKVRAKIRDVQLRLQKDPGLFAELARRFSDDKVTGPKGGEVGWIKRLDSRLPLFGPVIRAAWELDEGAITPQPVETFYGLHLVRRVKFVQNHYILFYGKTIRRITNAKKEIDQEDILFDVRKRHSRKLHL